MSEHGEESIMEKIYGRSHRRSSSSSSSSGSDSEGGKRRKRKNKPESAHVPPPEVVPDEPEMSAPEIPHHPPPHHDSSSASSNKNKIYRLFGRERPVHKVLGGGKVADVCLWRNKKVSGNVLGAVTVIWFLFELLEYHLLTLACHVLIITLGVLYVWSNASSFINKDPPHIPDVHIPEKALMQVATVLTVEINKGLAVLRSIASGKDLKKFFAVIGGLWFISVIGGCFNFLTLIYLTFLLLLTLPMLYEKYEDKVDAMAEMALKEMKKQYAAVDAKVLSKMPSIKEKKLK